MVANVCGDYFDAGRQILSSIACIWPYFKANLCFGYTPGIPWVYPGYTQSRQNSQKNIKKSQNVV